ncbi:hypothetical protein SUGI_0787560 [Cryptomeria japonica]|nr:hypothetical protein SUGI_0787560 [Cryptomeria japonica]
MSTEVQASGGLWGFQFRSSNSSNESNIDMIPEGRQMQTRTKDQDKGNIKATPTGTHDASVSPPVGCVRLTKQRLRAKYFRFTKLWTFGRILPFHHPPRYTTESTSPATGIIPHAENFRCFSGCL